MIGVWAVGLAITPAAGAGPLTYASFAVDLGYVATVQVQPQNADDAAASAGSRRTLR